MRKVGLALICIITTFVTVTGCGTQSSSTSPTPIPTNPPTLSQTTTPAPTATAAPAPTTSPAPAPTATAAPAPTFRPVTASTAKPTPVPLTGKSHNTPTPFLGEVNGSANNAMEGFASLQDGWIYYAYENGLYKMKADGTEKMSLCEMSEGSLDGINVKENWIYFDNYSEGIYRIKTDGTRMKQVWSAYDCEELNVAENQIYLTNWDNYTWNLYKMNVRENKMKVLRYNTPTEPNMYIVNDWIYLHMDEYGKTKKVYKMQTDGTKLQLALEEKVYDFTVSGDWIYYLVKTQKHDIYKLYKAKTDGKQRQMIAKNIKVDLFSGLNVAGDWIYYLVTINLDKDLYNLYKIKTDGTERQRIAEEISIDFGRINVTGDWIFYEATEYDYEEYGVYGLLYRIKTDGSMIEKIESNFYRW